MDEYFRALRVLCQKIDSDTKELENTWKRPHFLISGYGENVEEAIPYVENFLCALKDIQDQLIEDRESRSDYITKTDEDLASLESAYRVLREECQEAETLLSEYDYKPLPRACANLSIVESETESSILTPEQMESSITRHDESCQEYVAQEN